MLQGQGSAASPPRPGQNPPQSLPGGRNSRTKRNWFHCHPHAGLGHPGSICGGCLIPLTEHKALPKATLLKGSATTEEKHVLFTHVHSFLECRHSTCSCQPGTGGLNTHRLSSALHKCWDSGYHTILVLLIFDSHLTCQEG